MKRNISNLSKAAVLITIILIAGAVNASILASASVDKKTLGENEVAMLDVKLMNDSQSEIKNVNLRVQGDAGLVFYDSGGETPIFINTIDSIKPNEVKEIVIKMKAAAVNNASANIYAYYGMQSSPDTAAVTVIQTANAAASASATTKTQNVNGNDTAVIDFSLTNASKKPIYNASAETLAPQGFEILTPPVTEQKILPGGVMEQSFNIKMPIEAQGEQKILVAYGYFDDTNTPHYFEQTFPFNVQKTNYPLIGIIGVIVLIIAAYLFMRKGKSSGINGTAEKTGEEKPAHHKK